MKISILEPIGINECKFNQLKQDFEKLGHEFVFFADRNENDTSSSAVGS